MLLPNTTGLVKPMVTTLPAPVWLMAPVAPESPI